VDARTPAPASPDVGVVYFTIRNGGGADQLVSASTDVAGSAEVHTEIKKGSLITMAPAGPVAVPAHGRVSLSAGGTHLMLIGLTRTLKEGDQFGMTLHFRRFGDVKVSVPVVAYAAS
jgi:copper(I)-binding protein